MNTTICTSFLVSIAFLNICYYSLAFYLIFLSFLVNFLTKDPLTLLWDPPQGFSKHHLIKREEPFSYGKIYFVHFGEVSTP